MPAGSTTEGSTDTDSNSGAAVAVALIAAGVPESDGDQPVGRAGLDRRTVEIGRELFERMGRGPRPWHRAWWENLFIAATLDDTLVRVQLFRFIDALPALHTDGAVRRHLAEYLAEAGDRVPWWLRTAIGLAPPGTAREGWLAAVARRSAGVMARKFIAGATPAEAIQTVVGLRGRKLAFTADLLGEAVISEREADVYQETCLTLVRDLDVPIRSAEEIPLIDRDGHGPIPRVNLSLKLSSLTAHFEPIQAARSIEHVSARLRPILRLAREKGAQIHVDMEQYAYRALSYELFCRVLEEPEFRDWSDVGIVVQAYHGEAESELRMLRDWVNRRGSPITIRLVKGAYWDYEVATARRLGWPEPVYLQKWQSDACFERCASFLVENHDSLRPAFGSHNVRSLAHAIAAAESKGLSKSAYELQTLYGMGDAIQKALVERGHRVRVYTPYGAILPGMAYLVRRLLENTSNESFLKASLSDKTPVEELLRDPEEVGKMLSLKRRPKSGGSAALPGSALPPFRNEPPVDFARAENREAMRQAIETVRLQLGRSYPLLIDGREIHTETRRLPSVDPSHSSRIVGQVALAEVKHADAAVAAARKAFPGWSTTPPAKRAAVLIEAAKLMRERRRELAAWEIFECGKPWAEADGDIAEAIDFCEFYAREMCRLAEPVRCDASGEMNYTEPIGAGWRW